MTKRKVKSEGELYKSYSLTILGGMLGISQTLGFGAEKRRVYRIFYLLII